MDEYIEREAVVMGILGLTIVDPMVAQYADAVLHQIQQAPADDVAPVRNGRWERIGIKGRKGLPIYPCCSDCGIVSSAFRSEWEGLRGPWKYCPNCGCRMDG